MSETAILVSTYNCGVLLMGCSLTASRVQVDLEVAEHVDWRLWSVVPVYVKVRYACKSSYNI